MKESKTRRKKMEIGYEKKKRQRWVLKKTEDVKTRTKKWTENGETRWKKWENGSRLKKRGICEVKKKQEKKRW